MPEPQKKRISAQKPTWEEFAEILGRHRRWLDSGGREGEKADFTGAQLSGWDFSGQDLTAVNFRDADLSKAVFQDANLEDADFRGADLREADFTKVRHLLPSQLAGADLSDCRLPEDLEKFTSLPHVDAATRHAKTLFFTQLLVCVFCWLTIFVTTDPGLLTNTIETPLPVINTKINIVMFYWAAPSLLFCLYLYFHLCLQRLWEAVAQLPAYFPDGRPLPQRLHPWLLHGLIWAFFPRLRRDRPVLTWLQNLLNKFLAWWVVPLTLFFLWGRYLPAHEWVVTAIQIGLLTLAVTAGVTFSVLSRRTLRLRDSRPFRWQKAWRDLRLYQVGALCVGTCLMAGALSIFSSYAFQGWFAKGYERKYLAEKKKQKKKPLTESPFRAAKMFAVISLSYEKFFSFLADKSCANLVEAEVSTKPANWTYNKPEDLKAVKGAKLRGRNLRGARGSKAFLVNADLQEAGLHGAVLWRAELQGADLSAAELQGAYLSAANLQGANLGWANLQGAQLNGAHLQGAVLSWAELQEAFLYGAELQGANLDGAQLQGADLSSANLQKANLTSAELVGASLSYAQLQGADLGYAQLQRATLDGAQLQGADLIRSHGLTKGNLVVAHGWPLAKYSPEMLERLNLPKENNDNLDRKDLSSYPVLEKINFGGCNLTGFKFRKANLKGAVFDSANLEDVDLSEADLRNSSFRGANLKGAKLQDANLQGADLSKAKGLIGEQLLQAKIDGTTKLPYNSQDLLPARTPH